MKSKSFSVTAVITTYNEEERIENCIKSIIDVFSKAGLSYEIVMVDSSSEDRTISKSDKYPIKIISLKGQRSPSLGQHVGFLNSKGDVIFFIDGDMELIIDPSEVCPLLEKLNDKVAGLQGYFIDYQTDGTKNNLHKVSEESKVSFLPGSAFYSRAALVEENFNPFLSSNEERDLGYRLKDAGFSLLRVPIAMVNHHRKKSTSGFSELLRRHRNNLFRGSGQVFRCQKTLYSFFQHFLYLKYDFMFATSLVLILFSFFYNYLYFLSAIVFSHILLLSYYKFNYGNINRYFIKYFIFWGILTGFLTYRKHKVEYDFIK